MHDSQRPIAFLDFDGVLNHAGMALLYGRTSMKFDRMCCLLMLKLCEVTQARVVISSAWREGRSVQQLVKMIEVRGDCQVPGQLVIDTTAFSLGTRGEQIAAWRKSTEHIGPYVIGDDFHDFLPEQAAHLVLTSSLRGFGFSDFAAALLILDRASPLMRELHHHIDNAQRVGLVWSEA